jgi:uncharacterized protein (DUF983 family)
MKMFSNSCPRCNSGKVFQGLFKMNISCPECGLKIEREQGYFYGAMFVQYTLIGLIILATMIVGLAAEISEWSIGVACVLEILLISPFLFRLSRLAWLHLDYRSHPAEKP